MCPQSQGQPPVPRVLIVEDDPASRATLGAYLAQEAYDVAACGCGDEMDEAMARRRFDLMLLDISLPGRDGLTLLREIRTRPDPVRDMGVVMVTARCDTVDRVVGLELGADDYVTKPYERRELLARVKNVLRRVAISTRGGLAAAERSCYRFEGWSLDLARRRLCDPQGADVPLTTGEFDLLAVLATNAERVMSRDRLLDAVAAREWTPSDRSVDVLIGRLRKKLGDDPKTPRFLITVRNAGYVFAAPVS